MSNDRVKKLLAELASLSTLNVGEMALKISRRLDPGVSVRITRKGVRVTRSTYCDNLSDAMAVNEALRANKWIKCEAPA